METIEFEKNKTNFVMINGERLGLIKDGSHGYWDVMDTDTKKVDKYRGSCLKKVDLDMLEVAYILTHELRKSTSSEPTPVAIHLLPITAIVLE